MKKTNPVTTESKPILGITIGDPSGIGPEVTLKACEHPEIQNLARLVLYGDITVLENARRIVGSKRPFQIIGHPGEQPNAADRTNSLAVCHYETVGSRYEFGQIQAACGDAAFTYIAHAIDHAISGKIDAVVTGPINKEALHAAGHRYDGMTEIFAERTSVREYAMMLVGGPLKVIHVSTHCSLEEACRRVKAERVYNVIKLADDALRRLGVTNPRIAVAGLNPHAGEHGLFGDTESREIEPAIRMARADGIEVNGPEPPDTVFMHAVNGASDIVVVMYHDQGHIPLKLLDFMGGVNTTIGLPIIRTSVDHGTAFPIAGSGQADETSMINAITLASRFAETRVRT